MICVFQFQRGMLDFCFFLIFSSDTRFFFKVSEASFDDQNYVFEKSVDKDYVIFNYSKKFEFF